VSLQPLTPELADAFNHSDSAGALVGGVQPGTPAAKAGMREGDIVVEFNGKKVTDSAHLRIMVAQTPPKTGVTFKVARDGKEKNFSVTLGELPDDLMAIKSDDSLDRAAEARASSLEGVEFADLDNEARRRFKIPARIQGALVTNVEEDSAAAEAGLRPGDVVVEIERKPVQTAEDTIQLTSHLKGKRVTLRVYNQAGGFGGTRYVSVLTGKK
jgi:serine protease Do